MRFSVVLCDQASVETLSRYVNATSKLCKKRCCVRIQEEGLCFISSESLQDNGCWFCIFLPKDSQLFHQYDFSGLNERIDGQNFIYMDINIGNLAKILTGPYCYLKLKLTRSEPPAQEPIIRVEVRSSDSDIVRHELPVSVIMSRYWNNYEKPSVGQRKLSIFLPPPRTLYRVLQSYKNMNAKVLAFNASRAGDLRLEATIDHGEVDVLFTDLPSDQGETDSQEDWARVKLMLKTVCPLFQSFLFSSSRVKLNIISNRMAELSMRSEDHQLCFIVGNVSD